MWIWRSAILSVTLAASVALAADPVLTVQRAGTGNGDVTNGGPEISCGATCTSSFAPGTSVTLTPAALPGSRFTGWLGPCTGTGSCTFTINGNTTAIATFALATAGLPRLDIDGTFACEAASDGLIALRYLFGISGAALNADAQADGALRASPSALLAYLTDARPAFDIDGNGQADPLTDGVLILRYLLGLTGDALVANAIGAGATRTTAAQIEPVLGTLCSIAVFVATTGSDAAPGTRAAPKQTIAAGLAAAAAADAALVVVGAGTYLQSPTLLLLADRTVLGGYDPGTWTPGGGPTTIQGGGSAESGESQHMAVLAKNLATPAALVDVTVSAASAPSGKNSHGIVAIGANLSLLHVNVLGGNGGSATPGSNGPNAATLAATAGMKGMDGGPAAPLAVICDNTTRGAGGAGGTNGGIAAASGGAGGPGGPIDTTCTGSPITSDLTAQPGATGGNASTTSLPNFGGGGAGGPANASTVGSNGKPGLVVNGAGGTGGGTGLVVAGNYLAAKPGTAGSAGSAGGGGGGGGGSGGNDSGTDSYGAGGGGGGAGGAPGSGGGGGGGGGSSIGLYAINSTIAVAESTFVRGIGGTGGAGGIGGQGQAGGAGGLGGPAADDSPAGGAGGAGGHGGHGGGGGGGAGGTAYGIVLRNVQSQIGLTLYSGGGGGGGGAGGASAPLAIPQDGNNGTGGSAGATGGLLNF